ncbi:MAG: hypothetical protein Q4D44_07625 [Eubacteriales bacterium]|nr:hypothetical protein [Eubacteriales bacterium]
MNPITAYIDVATLSMVFAAVAGVAVTIGAVVGVYVRRAKNKINETLGIDENEKKEKETDVTGSFED